MNINAGQFKFDEDTKRSHLIANRPAMMYWDDILIFMATKKAYIIMQKDTGNILRSFPHDKLNFPVMTVSKTKCLILDTPSTAVYFDEGAGINKNIVFRIDPVKVLSTISLQENYVIVVYENSVAVFNASTGDKLEEKIVCDKSFKFKASCINFKGSEVYLVT
jgi:hypothetical protein